jgi:hypothetical protein
MYRVFKKILAAIISMLIGLILIPILTLEFTFKWLPQLIVYFLPGFSIGLIILFELLIRMQTLRGIYNFVKGYKMIVLFFALLLVEWTIMWTVDPSNDVVFTSQFATAMVPSVWMYGYIGRKMSFLH